MYEHAARTPTPTPTPPLQVASEPAGRWRTDLTWVAAATLGCWALASLLELRELSSFWLARYERWQIDELPFAFTVLASGLAWYAWRRRGEALVEVERRRQAQAHAQSLLAHNRELARQLITLQENERLALARELHDEIGQSCSAIRVETAYIRHCGAADYARAIAAAERADAAAQGLYQGVRGLLRRLRPANLDTLGLVAAVQELCESWEERSGVQCICSAEGLDAPVGAALGGALDVTLYRVAQEALTNVMQHAGASAVRVVLVRGDGEVRLSVQDDGRGMDVAAATRGLGLLGATERAAALGGTLALHSAPGAGTRLLLRLPLPAAAEVAT